MASPDPKKPTVQAFRPEVLAPGGSLDAIEAAVNAGADAVYVGVGLLNARTRAANLTVEQLPGVVDLAHSRGAAIHVALNVPVTPTTLPEAVRVLAASWLSGADAVILRDPILIGLAARELPGLALHASTQMGILGPAAAKRAHGLGCTRVILPRELSAADIRRIRKAVPDLELEAFFFGALCFGVSGRCLLGEAVAGRSGNHGSCAQPCRLEYFAADGAPLGRIFSMRDLDLFPRIRELVDAGVSSLKIEGRLKSPAWVACVTSYARTASRNWRTGGLAPDELAAFHRDVAVLFCRPRTSAFFDGSTDVALLTCPASSGQAGLAIERFDTMPRPRSPTERAGRVLGESVERTRERWQRTGASGALPGIALRFVTPVDLALRDGLLVTTALSGPGQSEALPIVELADENGRPAGRIPAGRVAVVTLPLDRPPLTVAIHSANSVEARFPKGNLRLSQASRNGELPAPSVTRVVMAQDRIFLTGAIGRFRTSAELPVATEPARNQGMTPGMMQRYFPEAEADVAPDLYANPTELKAVRRAFAAQGRESYRAELERLARRLLDDVLQSEPVFAQDDASLLARGPACVSRVTGLPPGEVRTSGGDRFVVEPTRRGTVVRAVRRP